MTYRIVVTARARADAIRAFRWIAERSPDSASRWSAGLQKAIVKLGQFPDRNPVAEEESEQVGIILRQCSTADARTFTASSIRSKAIPSTCTISATAPRARSRLEPRPAPLERLPADGIGNALNRRLLLRPGISHPPSAAERAPTGRPPTGGAASDRPLSPLPDPDELPGARCRSGRGRRRLRPGFPSYSPSSPRPGRTTLRLGLLPF